jgi:flagellin-specific chaperone FliS
MNRMDLVYRQTAAVGASGLSLLLPLFDRLANDLRRGAEAQRGGDLEARSRELNHGLAVIGFLENWVDRESGDLARQMSDFYTSLRAAIVQAQAQQSPEILELWMGATLNLREVFQSVDLNIGAPGPEILPPAPSQRYPQTYAVMLDDRQLSWTA